MIFSFPQPNADTPRVSANQLAEFAFASNTAKVNIVRDQKFGNLFRAPYYQPALTALLASFRSGRYHSSDLEAAAARLMATTPRSKNHKAKLANNAGMLSHFLAIIRAAQPPVGDHEIVRRNAYVDLDGVWISVRSEIVTQAGSRFAFTKLRFSKSRVSADASELILQILIEFGRRQEKPGHELNLADTRLIDCHAESVVLGHELPLIRARQLRGALRDYRAIWSSLQPPSSGLAAAVG